MAYDPGALEASLAAAVGDEPSLIAELRGAFLSGATAHIATLRRACDDDEWVARAQRLASLAASFGALRLMDAARAAASAGSRNERALKRIEHAVAAFREDVA